MNESSTPPPEPPDERSFLTYEGTHVPLGTTLLWLAFLVFGFGYFALHVLG